MIDRRQAGREALAATLDELREEGLRAAYERGIALLRDDTAPPTAHAQLVRVFFAAAGLGSPAAEEPPTREPHQMTAAELAEAVRQARASLLGRTARGRRGEADEDDAGDVFG